MTPSLNIADLQAKLNKTRLSSRTCYDAFKTMGIDYGPAHQGLERIYLGNNEVLAKLTLPTSVSETKDQFILHPSLLDSALQASIALHINDRESKLLLQPTAYGTQLPLFCPFALEHIEIIDDCPESMWVRGYVWTQSFGFATPVWQLMLQKLDIDLV